MYVNGKMIPIETVPRMGGGGAEGEWVNSSMIYLIHCKNFCKCILIQQNIKREKRKNIDLHELSITLCMFVDVGAEKYIFKEIYKNIYMYIFVFAVCEILSKLICEKKIIHNIY
jgi:hypothetical protein